MSSANDRGDLVAKIKNLYDEVEAKRAAWEEAKKVLSGVQSDANSASCAFRNTENALAKLVSAHATQDFLHEPGVPNPNMHAVDE